MIKRIVILLVATVTLITAATGCRTAKGFGEDMEHAGEKIQDKTDR